MSVIWQLPGDILHSVYSEWLEWEDLSRLDVACVGKSDREVWLTSLTDLRIFHALGTFRVSDAELRLFYIWLKSRRVFCVEDFPVSVNVLEDLMVGGLDMESYYPALRSFHISRGSGIKSNPDVDEVKDNLSDFLSHCHSLEGVAMTIKDDDSYFNVVLGVLVEKLRENSLVKISLPHQLHSSLTLHESQLLMVTLLTKHACSLRDLSLNAMRLDLFFSSLIKNEVHLRVLDVFVVDDLSENVLLNISSHLISYLSSAGDLLESLKVDRWPGYYKIDDILVSAATSCPKLTRLELNGGDTCSMEKVRLLYEQCPYLQDVCIPRTIDTNVVRKSMTIYVKGSNDDWAVCLSHALRRRQFKKVTLILIGCYYHSVVNLKSMLEPYEICLSVETSDDSFISLLQDLPHLSSLYLGLSFCQLYLDATLTTIVTQHTKRLTELLMEFDDADLNSDGPRVYDKRMSDLIKTCQLLERLKMPCDGLESLVAISKHSSLRIVDLTMTESVPIKMLDGLLLNDKVTLPSSLVRACIRKRNYYYEFDENIPCHWSKQKLY
eukprot:scaffold2180_cov194-Ochromonas_danica.AAC.5